MNKEVQSVKQIKSFINVMPTRQKRPNYVIYNTLYMEFSRQLYCIRSRYNILLYGVKPVTDEQEVYGKFSKGKSNLHEAC